MAVQNMSCQMARTQSDPIYPWHSKIRAYKGTGVHMATIKNKSREGEEDHYEPSG